MQSLQYNDTLYLLIDDDTIELKKIDSTTDLTSLVKARTATSIATIHRDVLAIQDIFKDLDIIVNLQQESIDKIESNIDSTEQKVESALDNIIIAEQNQKWFRKTVFIAPVLLVGSAFAIFKLVK